MKYQQSNKKYLNVETKNEEEEKAIRILNNEFYKERNKQKTINKKIVSLEQLNEKKLLEISDEINIKEDILKQEEIFILKQAISKLSKKQKEIIYRHFYCDKSFREIAKEKQESISSIFKTYKRAIKKLKNKITQ